MRKHLFLLIGSTFFACCKEQPVEQHENLEKSIVITSPFGMQTYILGDMIKVTWESESINKMELKTSRGEVLLQQINAKKTSEVSYSANYLGKYILKLIDIEDRSIFDISDTITVIEKIADRIEIVELHKNKLYTVNDSILILWNDNSIIDRKLNLSITYNDGISWDVVAKNIDSKISEYLYINTNKILSNKCRVKIEDSENPNIYDLSDYLFAIFNPEEFDMNYFPIEIGNLWN
jgi:hypothetical protein